MSDYSVDTDESLEPLQDPDINTDTTGNTGLDVFEESNSVASVNTCSSDDLSELFSFRVAKSESYNSTYRLAPNSNAVFNSNNTFDKPFLPHSPSLTYSPSLRYSPSHTVPMISCSGISGDETVLQEGISVKITVRGFDDGNGSDDDSSEDNTGFHGNLLTHYHSSNPQHSIPNSPRYKSLSAAVNTSLTPQTSASISHVALKHEGKTNSKSTNFMLPKSSSKGDYLIGDSYSLAERRPILLDVPNGRNELVMATYSTQSNPKLHPIVGLHKALPGIALPPPIPLDLPKIKFSRKATSIPSHQQLVGKQPLKADHGLGTFPRIVFNQRPQSVASGCQRQQQAPLSQSLDFSDPVGIISRAAVFLHAGDYGAMLKILEILDKHLVLPEDIDMAKEFGQGLAHYKNQRYRAAKPCFNALLEKSINYGSPGNQALASIYLGEIEMSWAKYKDAEKHFTLAVTYYSSDNVAEKFQETIFTKSTVLRKKGQCHWRLSQMREAFNAFKMAKDEAVWVQQQTRGSTLKTAKENELSALFELGNILQSIGDYEQSFENYEKSLKLAGELEDHVSLGRAHGNLGNAMLGLDQKDKALDHLIMAFEISKKYEGNLLAVGRAAYNLGSAYETIGNLPKAKEHYKIALQYNKYGNDLNSQSYICNRIAFINRLLKEPVEAVHYYTETLRLSTDKNTKITGYHNRGCARYDVAECILQGMKPKELVTATTPGPTYGRLTIKLTDDVITTDPQETKLNSQPVSKQEESIKTLPIIVDGKTYDGVTNTEIIQLVEALPFLEAAKRDFHKAIELQEQSVQNSKDSHEASSSRSFYKIQETLVELGKLRQRLSELGVMDTVATEPQEFKEALVYGEQARARTLGELFLQKKRAMYSDLFSISTPLKLQDIYRAVQLQKVPVVFISYCLSKLLMWILVSVKDEVVVKFQSIDLKKEELENRSLELYLKDNLLQFDFLSQGDIHIFRPCSYEQESPFTVLYDVIGVKIIEGLKSVGFSEGTEFIIIPDSVTHSIPFSSLMNKHNSQCFGDKYRIRIVPSFLSLLVMSMTSNPVVEVPGDKNDFLVVGNLTVPPFMYDTKLWNLPQLPDAEKEAIDIASITGTIPVLRGQATKQSVLDQMRSFNHKVIHLATHGSPKFLVFTSSFPVSMSGLAEKEHILIFPEEIETLNISPALVVLSACNLARGQVKAEGIIGAFLLADAHSVVAKLWRAPDESTKIFVAFFYRFLINGLPSPEALQRSMQCLRCFLKYSNYVHWSGFHIFGKEITFHRNLHAHFPIQKMLGEVSIFPRQQHVKSIEESLLGVQNKIFTDVQLLVGSPGNEPEECARDFINNCYYHYPCGVYWYNASTRDLLEASVKVAHETPLMGGVYKEQKELDPLPTITNPSLLTTASSRPISRKDKKLIVLDNFTNFTNYHVIMSEIQEDSTDIIIVCNKPSCKDKIIKDFYENFHRGCNIIEVTSLEPISITQRIVYALLEKNSFVAGDADRTVLALLSEYSRGAATIVHLLASLLQKGDKDNRKNLELVKQKFISMYQRLQLSQESEEMQRVILSQNSCILDMLGLSKPAKVLISCLCKLGPVPLPLYFIRRVNSLIINEIVSHQTILEPPLKELGDKGVIRNFPSPLVYHKDLNPKCLDSSMQLIFIPELICDAVKSEIKYDNEIPRLQHALEIIIQRNPSWPYIDMVCGYLQALCEEQQQPELGHLNLPNIPSIFPTF